MENCSRFVFFLILLLSNPFHTKVTQLGKTYETFRSGVKKAAWFLCKLHVIERPNAHDQIAFCAFHSFFNSGSSNQWWLHTMQSNSNLEIRIVGSFSHQQLYEFIILQIDCACTVLKSRYMMKRFLNILNQFYRRSVLIRRSSIAPVLSIPRESGKFQHSAATIFNKLPVAIRNITEYNSLCRGAKRHLLYKES